MTILEALRQTATSIKTWAESKFLKKDEITADDFGVYVQDVEPANAKEGDIWIDTANDPKAMEVEIPTTLPNPHALKFEGAIDSVYDGSRAIKVVIPDVPSKTSELTNDSGFITGYTETDPTVPSWAKAASKPSYSKSEVGLGNVDNVKQYSANNPPPYPVTSVNKKTGAVSLTYSDVGADASGTASSLITNHNASTSAHTDIRNALAEKQAKGDYALKSDVPTKVSQLTNDKNYLTSYTETDPTVPAWAKATSKPTYTKSEIGLGNVDNVKQYSASNPPPYPVQSVNGKTGAVTLSVLPSVTTADNGKVLMVVNGAWSVVDINLSIDSNGVLSV